MLCSGPREDTHVWCSTASLAALLDGQRCLLGAQPRPCRRLVAHLVRHAGVALRGEVEDLEHCVGVGVQLHVLLVQQHGQHPGGVVPATVTQDIGSASKYECCMIPLKACQTVTDLEEKAAHAMASSEEVRAHSKHPRAAGLDAASRHGINQEPSTAGLSTSSPEDARLSKECIAESLSVDQHGSVFDAVHVISAIHHPGGAGGERVLARRQQRPKGQCDNISPLQQGNQPEVSGWALLRAGRSIG